MIRRVVIYIACLLIALGLACGFIGATDRVTKPQITALEERLTAVSRELAVLKKQTRPIINIKYGTVYHADGEIVIEEKELEK